MKKIIIDTDPGIDDAMAIMMALHAFKKKELDILGITLVNGNTTVEHAQVNVLRILDSFDLAGKIPVHVGASRGLVQKNEMADFFHGEDGFSNFRFPEDPPSLSLINREETATEFITRTVRQHPGEVTLVALGPLTNVAICCVMDDNFGRSLREITLMGGNTDAAGNVTACAEFNFHADPEAAYVVLERAGCDINMVPWETCTNAGLTWDWRINSFKNVVSKPCNLMNKLEEKWFRDKRNGGKWMACDQLAMALVLDENCIKRSSKYQATIELYGLHTRGQVVLEKRLGKAFAGNVCNVTIIEELDTDRLKTIISESLRAE